MQGCTLLVFCRASPADLLLSCVPMVASGKAERFGAKKEAKKHPPPPRPPPIWGGCKQKFAETVKFFYVLVGKDDSLYFLIGCAERRKLRKCLEDNINYRISGFAEDRLHLGNKNNLEFILYFARFALSLQRN